MKVVLIIITFHWFTGSGIKEYPMQSMDECLAVIAETDTSDNLTLTCAGER